MLRTELPKISQNQLQGLYLKMDKSKPKRYRLIPALFWFWFIRSIIQSL